jgi:hypothetical protein
MPTVGPAADFLARLEEPNHVLFVQIPKPLRGFIMASIESGILLIADISGYTKFLASYELEHAQDSLRSLLNLIIEHTRPPLVISRLELRFEDDFPLPPLMMWDIVSSPQYKAILSGSQSARVDKLTNGRIGLGATFYCSHGNRVSTQTIVDWQPPREYTWTSDPVFGIYTLNTVRLSSSEEGSHLEVLFGEPTGGRRLTRWLFIVILGPIASRGMKRNLCNLHRQIKIDLSEERLCEPTTRAVEGDEVLSAAREALTIE